VDHATRPIKVGRGWSTFGEGIDAVKGEDGLVDGLTNQASPTVDQSNAEALTL